MTEKADLERLRIDRGPRRAARSGSTGGRWFLRLVVLAALAGLVFLFRAPLLEQVDRLRLPQVEVRRAVRSSALAASAVQGTAANGYVVARRRAALSAEAPGRIVEMNVQEGSVVRAGDVVARLDFAEQEAAHRQALANLTAAEASRDRARAEVDAARARLAERGRNAEAAEAVVEQEAAQAQLAVLDAERAQALFDKGIGKESDVDRTVAERDAAAARVTAARAGAERAASELATAGREVDVAEGRAAEAEATIAVLEAARDAAAAALEKTNVRAPFDGVVVLKDAEVGEVVSPNSQGGQSRGSVATLVDFASLEVQVEVPEANLADVRVDAPAEVFLDAFPAEGYPGRVTRIWPTANRQKATVEVRVALMRLDERLRPEMGARVVFRAEESEPTPVDAELANALLVPDEALVTVGGTRGLFVVERDVVSFRQLELGAERSGRVLVEAGLEEGELYVVSPPNTLGPGDRVRYDA